MGLTFLPQYHQTNDNFGRVLAQIHLVPVMKSPTPTPTPTPTYPHTHTHKYLMITPPPPQLYSLSSSLIPVRP